MQQTGSNDGSGKNNDHRQECFSGCTGLTSLTLPYGVVSVGNAAFYNCSGLMYFLLPESITTIGSSALSGCGNWSISQFRINMTSLTIPCSPGA